MKTIYQGRGVCRCLEYGDANFAISWAAAVRTFLKSEYKKRGYVCVSPGCSYMAFKKGACMRHITSVVPAKLCLIEGCNRKIAGRHLCMKHYTTVVRRGKPIPKYDHSDNAGSLDEEEYARMKEFKANGLSVEETAIEMRRKESSVRSAWPFESYFLYSKRLCGVCRKAFSLDHSCTGDLTESPSD